MIVMGNCNTEPELGLLNAMAVSARGTTGFHVGGYVKTKIRDQEYMCEIEKMSEKRVHLVGLGWVDISKCYV